MDLLSFAAETGSMEEWIDLDSHHHPTLIRQAAALDVADADGGVQVRAHRGMTVLGTLAGILPRVVRVSGYGVGCILCCVPASSRSTAGRLIRNPGTGRSFVRTGAVPARRYTHDIGAGC